MSQRRTTLTTPRAELAQKLIKQDCMMLRDNIRGIRSNMQALTGAARDTVHAPVAAVKEALRIREHIEQHPRLSLSSGLLLGFAAVQILFGPKENPQRFTKDVAARAFAPAPESLADTVVLELKKTLSSCVEKTFDRLRQEVGHFLETRQRYHSESRTDMDIRF